MFLINFYKIFSLYAIIWKKKKFFLKLLIITFNELKYQEHQTNIINSKPFIHLISSINYVFNAIIQKPLSVYCIVN